MWATISLIDHFPGAGRFLEAAGVTPFKSLASFAGAAANDLTGSALPRYPNIRCRYCSAVSGMLTPPDGMDGSILNQTGAAVSRFRGESEAREGVEWCRLRG